jgi:hypothetical protein
MEFSFFSRSPKSAFFYLVVIKSRGYQTQCTVERNGSSGGTFGDCGAGGAVYDDMSREWR